MNDWQMMRQAKWLLEAAVWPDAAVVFPSGSVVPSAAIPEDQIPSLRLPACILQSDGAQADPEFGELPNYVTLEFGAYILQANEGDQYGEGALTGRNRGTGSAGRGLLEVASLARETLVQLGPESGLPTILRSQSAPSAVAHPTLQYVAAIALKFQAVGTLEKTWQTPFAFVATGGAGQVAMTWDAMPRFDRLRFVLRRAAGATPPATKTDGTGVTLASNLATSVTDTGLAAGTYSYSLFMEYDDTGAGSVTGTSAPTTWISAVVT